MKKLMVMAAASAALFSVPAFGQAPGGRGGFGQRDQTRAEAQQRADIMFQMMDSNHDGVVTRAEADQALAKFEAMRSDGDSRRGAMIERMIDHAFAGAASLTQQQFEAHALARFDAMDLNHDGVVTAAEREQLRQQRAQGQPPVAPAAPSAGAVPPPHQ